MPRRGDLGRDGLDCFWKPEKKSLERIYSLKVAEALGSWPESSLSSELRRYLEGQEREPVQGYQFGLFDNCMGIR